MKKSPKATKLAINSKVIRTLGVKEAGAVDGGNFPSYSFVSKTEISKIDIT